MPMRRFDLLEEYTTICVPVRMQTGLPKSFADERDERLIRAGHLPVVIIGRFFRAIAAFGAAGVLHVLKEESHGR